MQNNLGELRERINRINEEILGMLNFRASYVREISLLKNEGNIEYFDPIRVQEMLENILKKNKGPLPNELVKDIFSNIFSACLFFMELQKDKLLVGSDNDVSFKDIKSIFGLEDDKPIIIAGPCSVENYQYLEEIGELLYRNNIKFLRAGAFKPRTSPYEFQGLKEEGLKILKDVAEKFDLITVSEIVDTRDVEMMLKYVDILQIGARNMHNFELLKEVGQTKHPVLLKRGLSATIQELVFAAEYIALQGNRCIILCERGIRTFETKTRNTLDISSIPILKKETKLPVIVDLSHSLGRKDIIIPMAKSIIAAGADGLMVEVHPYPELALSDSKQQLNPCEFKDMIMELGF